jgi:hypothetical protein
MVVDRPAAIAAEGYLFLEAVIVSMFGISCHFLQDLESLNGTVAFQARSHLIGQKEFRSHHQLSAQADATLFSPG